MKKVKRRVNRLAFWFMLDSLTITEYSMAAYHATQSKPRSKPYKIVCSITVCNFFLHVTRNLLKNCCLYFVIVDFEGYSMWYKTTNNLLQAWKETLSKPTELFKMDNVFHPVSIDSWLSCKRHAPLRWPTIHSNNESI